MIDGNPAPGAMSGAVSRVASRVASGLASRLASRPASWPARSLRSIVARLASVGLAGVLVAGCGLGGLSAAPSFDPAASCGGADRQEMKGAYPDLEARVPAQLQGQKASSRDSGRFCAPATLGTLWDAGIHETHYGGGIWKLGPVSGVQIAVFTADGLTVPLMADEYRSGAAADKRVQIVSATNETIAGRAGFRLNLVNGESHQAILVWPSADGAVVQVVIAADVDEAVVQEAIAALG